MLLAESPVSLEYLYKKGDFAETFWYGDYLRKITFYMKESPTRDKLMCEISDVQSTEWPDVESYDKKLNMCAKRVCNYIGTQQDPFIL